MAKTKVEKIIDANTALETALDSYLVEIEKLEGGNPSAITAMLTHLTVTAHAMKAAVTTETTSYLKQAKGHYTPDPDYTAAQKNYINSKV